MIFLFAKKFFRKIPLILLGFLFAFLFSILTDKILGIYLNRIGYFKALPPNIADVFDTKEFTALATISSQGLRNEVVIKPKPQDVFRILALGDSFTFGWGVKLDESWPKLLQKSLKLPGKKVEVINAGVQGAGLHDELKICKAYADQFQIDSVIVGFNSTNDLYQAAASEYQPLDLPQALEKIWPTLMRISRPVLTTWWHEGAKAGDVFTLSPLWKIKATELIKGKPKVLSTLDPEIVRDFTEGKLPIILEVSEKVDYLIKFLDPENFNFEIASTAKILKQIKSGCIGNRPSYLLFLPSYELLSKDYFKYRSGTGFLVDDKLLTFDLDTPLSKIAKQSGFIYISPLKQFRQDQCLGCYFLWDSHPTSLGHRRIADYIVRQIQIILNSKR